MPEVHKVKLIPIVAIPPKVKKPRPIARRHVQVNLAHCKREPCCKFLASIFKPLYSLDIRHSKITQQTIVKMPSGQGGK